METGKAIYNLLKDSADVGAICADRIYPELAQQDVDVPFIVYTVTDTTPSDTKNSTSKLDTARVELYCVSDDYEQSMNLGIAVRGALDRHTGTVSGVEVQSIDFDTSDVQFDPDQRVYVLEQTYDVRVQRTGTAVSVAPAVDAHRGRRDAAATRSRLRVRPGPDASGCGVHMRQGAQAALHLHRLRPVRTRHDRRCTRRARDRAADDDGDARHEVLGPFVDRRRAARAGLRPRVGR